MTDESNHVSEAAKTAVFVLERNRRNSDNFGIRERTLACKKWSPFWLRIGGIRGDGGEAEGLGEGIGFLPTSVVALTSSWKGRDEKEQPSQTNAISP